MKYFSCIIFSFFLLCSCSTTQELSTTPKKGEPVFVAPIGVQAYSFRHYFPKDIPGTLDRIKDMGITLIEGGSEKLPPEVYRKMCDDRGLKIPSTGTNFKELDEDPMAIVERAKILGATYVMCPWLPHERGNFSLADANKAIEVFNKAGKILRENGLTFCYHAHGFEFQPYKDGTLLDYIIQNTTPGDVSYEMDIFWVHFGGGDCEALLRKYGDRWKLMHLKDMKKGTDKNLTGGTNVEFNVPLGTGELDMPGIMKAAREIGIAYYFIEDESSSVVNQVPKSIAYLRSLKY